MLHRSEYKRNNRIIGDATFSSFRVSSRKPADNFLKELIALTLFQNNISLPRGTFVNNWILASTVNIIVYDDSCDVNI
jgi:hypothetical protein